MSVVFKSRSLRRFVTELWETNAGDLASNTQGTGAKGRAGISCIMFGCIIIAWD